MIAMTTRLFAALLLALPLAAAAAPLKVVRAQSSVSATFWQLNVPVEAGFNRFVATIDYDPAKPAQTRAGVTLETASLDLGDAEMNREVAKPEWFDTARYPKATFVTTSVKPAAAGKLTVNGTLTIKGRALDVSFPLTVATRGNTWVFDGQLPVRRTAFRVGEGEWLDTTLVADQVVIKFHFTAAQ